jgi:hypothetical protein
MRIELRTGRLVATAGVAALIALLATPAEATPVVDQEFTQVTNVGVTAVINSGCKYVGQSFTAGLSGTLTSVNIEVTSHAGAPPLRVAIRAMRWGKPFGDPLGFRYLKYPQAPLSRSITFAQQIPLVAGEHYAIVVSYKGAQPAPGPGLGSWAGAGTLSPPDLYPRGRMFLGDCPTYGLPTLWNFDPGLSLYDLHFRTFVEATTA